MTSTPLPCPVCCHPSHLLYQLHDDRFGYPGFFGIHICYHCGHTQTKGPFPEKLDELYTHYYPRSDLSLDDHIIPAEIPPIPLWLNRDKSQAFRWVPSNTMVLEIGCGYGESLGYYLKKSCVPYGVELDQNIKRVIEKFGYNIHIGNFKGSLYEENFFDYVVLAQVIEHQENLGEFLKDIKRVLKPEGRVVITTPNGGGWGRKVFRRKWIHWHVPYHLHCFSPRSLERKAEQEGFIVEHFETITSPEWLYYQWCHLATYPNERKASSYWSPRNRQRLPEKLFLMAFRILHKLKINHLLTHLFDCLNWGDNMVFILKKPL